MFTLYTSPLSANGRKVLAVNHHLGLQPEVVHIDVYRGEGRAPEYLSEAYGDFRLWSREAGHWGDPGRAEAAGEPTCGGVR